MVAEAAAEVGRPTFFSMLIIIIAHMPIFTLQRHEGRIFAPMAYTITSALIGSLLFSLTLVPVLCVYLMRTSEEEKENVHRPLRARVYRPVLTRRSARPKIVLAAAAVALVATLSAGSAARIGVSAGIERGQHLDQLHAAAGHRARRGERTLHQVRGQHCSTIPEVCACRFPGRTARRRHGSQADQHGRRCWWI